MHSLDYSQCRHVLFVALQTVAILRSGMGEHMNLLNTVHRIICSSWLSYRFLSCPSAECCPLGSREDTRRGARLCMACNRCPRRINGRYCGTSCEKYDRERLQQPQQHYPRPPSGVRPYLSTPSPSENVNWGNPGELSSVSNFTPENHQLSPEGGTRSLGFMHNSTSD